MENYQKVNYQKKLDAVLEKLKNEPDRKKLFLHSCCAPCSSYVLEYLSGYFDITVFYYNPNIAPKEEYDMRVEEQKRLILKMPLSGKVDFLEGEYHPEEFYTMAKGLEDIPEGGARCFRCYELRLRQTAIMAKAGGYDFFTTTLSISPMKNAAKLNEIGQELEKEYAIPYLPSDFKKKNGYKRSIELSRDYDLYRQNYCGCVFSKRDSCGKL